MTIYPRYKDRNLTVYWAYAIVSWYHEFGNPPIMCIIEDRIELRASAF